MLEGNLNLLVIAVGKYVSPWQFFVMCVSCRKESIARDEVPKQMVYYETYYYSDILEP